MGHENLPLLMLGLPLAAAALIALAVGRRRALSAALSVGAAVAACAVSWMIFGGPDLAVNHPWLSVGAGPGAVAVGFGFQIDGLAKTMLVVVTTVAALIHVYSLGYMADDPGKSRYFAGLSLFLFAMLGIVVAANLVMMFLFWELVGFSSYLLIGHWFTRAAPAAAANKAFIVNRIGDFGFMLGILTLWLGTGEIAFAALRDKVPALAGTGFITAAALLVFCGAAGKSAQFPLHVWLPDAMEGPTPVSALIHAATMVAAGVYLLVRVLFLVEAAPVAQGVIAWIGGGTALMAALAATQQNDIKRILAYSTLSQLGYMVMAAGALAGTAAMFHLFTHAFFKALLFLGAGAVIFALHHEQDIWRMGGLKKSLPAVFWTFLVGTLALAGCPGLSGFFSKDLLLAAVYARSPALFGFGLATAFLTAFYMFRLLVVVFLGQRRAAPAAAHGGHGERGGGGDHDVPAVMTIPLWVLAACSLVAGYGWVADHFFAFGPGGHGGGGGAHSGAGHGWLVPALATAAFLVGMAAAVALYLGKTRDPVRIPLFARKFYCDELYAWLIRWTQDLLAGFARWFDRWVLDAVIVRGVGGAVWVAGFALRFLQMGNLQGYSLLFGAGVVLLLYWVMFR